jgi:hypothetical protein
MSKIPPSKAVRELFEGLLNRDVEVAPTDPPDAARSAALGLYVSDAHRMSAVAWMDLRLAAYVGTAIGLIPAATALAEVESGLLSDAVYDNVGEVFNVFAATLTDSTHQHQRLYATYRGAIAAPADARALAGAIGNRLDLRVRVQKYGTGLFSCVLVP